MADLTQEEKTVIDEAWNYLVNRADIDGQIARVIQDNFKELFIT